MTAVPESRSLSASATSPRSTAAEQFVDLVWDVPAEGPRRLLNVVVATILLIVALPLMILIAIVIKLTSSGPIFYRQTRIGLDNRTPGDLPVRVGRRRSCDLGGRPFVIYKFRTMKVGAERGSGAVWAKKDDPRIIWIGRLLRQARLDELPQLFNVMKGDMNVVGPRPERPSIFARLSDEIELYRLRQRVRPGITGMAQVNQQYDRDMDDVRRKLDFDLQYIREQSVWTDFKIMLKTFPVVLFRKGGW
jgi:lipopolysaccharide/colanic/teichoic acid biosynthesis glycosyltransferase